MSDYSIAALSLIGLGLIYQDVKDYIEFYKQKKKCIENPITRDTFKDLPNSPKRVLLKHTIESMMIVREIFGPQYAKYQIGDFGLDFLTFEHMDPNTYDNVKFLTGKELKKEFRYIPFHVEDNTIYRVHTTSFRGKELYFLGYKENDKFIYQHFRYNPESFPAHYFDEKYQYNTLLCKALILGISTIASIGLAIAK